MAGRMKQLDGMRALTHLSLISLHASMLTTVHLPSSGPLWNAFKSNPIYTSFQAGGIQVDIMFLLSGFLLVHKLLTTKRTEYPSLTQHIQSRWIRLMPCIVVVGLLGAILGDAWDEPYRTKMNSASPLVCMLAMLSTIMNYLDPAPYGSFTLTLCWSCCVDFHVGIALMVVMMMLRSRTMSDEDTARRARWVFGALAVLSVVIRGSIFDVEKVNLFVLGKHSHFSSVQTDGSYGWIQEFYNHTWHATNDASELAHTYLMNMYSPTHTRYGPFAIGGFLACNLVLAQSCGNRRSILSTILAWLATFLALGQLVVPCLPPAEDAPIEAQFVATAALRVMSAMSAGVLLFRALVPRTHPWHWAFLSWFLALPMWAHIATISFCSYLVHFRVLMEFSLHEKLRKLAGLTLPGLEEENSPQWIMYMAKLTVVCMVVSFSIASVMHVVVEKPCARWLGSVRVSKKKVL